MNKYNNYKIGDTLLRTDYDAIKDELDKKWNVVAVLEPNKTVCFDKNVQISRNEFKKQYPTNKIVRDIKTADYYITKDKPNFWFWFSNGSSIVLEDKYRTKIYLDKFNQAIDYINGNAKVVSPDSIKFQSHFQEELPKEMIEKIGIMLQSPDKETVDLALGILFHYNHEKSIDDFYLLLCKANPTSFYKRTKSRVNEQKIKFIKSKFQNHRF